MKKNLSLCGISDDEVTVFKVACMYKHRKKRVEPKLSSNFLRSGHDQCTLFSLHICKVLAVSTFAKTNE